MASAQQPTFRVQSQIRNNATRMQDALVDLRGWEASIKKKDKQIRRREDSGLKLFLGSKKMKEIMWDFHKHKDATHDLSLTPLIKNKVRTGSEIESRSDFSSSIPSVRRKGTKSTTKTSDSIQGDIESVEAVEKTSAATHTHDKGYAKWDKFDVEAALHDASSSEDDERGEKDEGPCSRDQALTERYCDSSQPSLREQRQQVLTPATIVGTIPKPTSICNIPAAIGSESVEDIEVKERERGNIFFQSGDFQEAIKCYTKCQLINNRSIAAFSNRAMAHIKLKEYEKAEADCTLALKLDVTHQKTLLRRATARNALGKHRAALVDLLIAGRQGDNPEAVKAAVATRAMIRNAALRCPKVKISVRIAQQPSAAPVDKGLLASDAAYSKDVILSTATETAAVNASGSKCVLRDDKHKCVNDDKEILKDQVQQQLNIDEGDVKQQLGKAHGVSTHPGQRPSATASVDVVVKTSNLLSQRHHPIPRTSYEMERLWRNIKGRPDEERLAWLARFKQSTWSKVFGLSTDGEVLGQVLQCLRGSESDDLCIRAICGLSRAQGIRMVVLTLPNESKISLAELFKRVLQGGTVSPTEIKRICDVFQLPQC